MADYENGTWKLLSVNELPRDGRGYIDHKNCVGKTLKYEQKANKVIYEIKIDKYIPRCEENKYNPQFKIQYIFLKGTEYEEVIEKNIQCSSLISGANISGIIPSLNQWARKDNYWIGIDIKGREFKFSTNNKETEYNILHSTWSVHKRDNYVTTHNLNNTKQNWCIHKVVYFNYNKKEADKNIHNCIDHINNDKTDNRIENLRLATKSENSKNLKTNNEFGVTGLGRNGKGYYSQFRFEGNSVRTETKYDLEEGKIDNLIAQRYLGYKHNEDQFYRLNKLSEDRIKEVTDLLDKKIENNKFKVKKEKEYAYNFIEKDNLIGIKTFKKDGTPNEICWVDRDFGRIEEDKFIVKGRVCNGGREYFKINNNKLYVYVMVGYNTIHNYRNYNFRIDHINQKPNENYKDNLEIVTIKSNMMNKNNKGYIEYKRKKNSGYQINYACNWKYFDLYIGGLKQVCFNTEEEAMVEVKRRKEIVDKYRFRLGWQGSIENNIKALDEVIDFAEEHKLDVNDAYIVWKGLDTLENIKNYLNGIDKC